MVIYGLIWWYGITTIIFIWLFVALFNKVNALEKEKEKRDERLRHLTDPNVIDAELERSARRREAYDSKMAYPPRDDSGPAAVVTQPKLPRFNSKFTDRPPRYQPKKDG